MRLLHRNWLVGGIAACLADYERRRGGRPPVGRVHIAGEVHLLRMAPGEPLHLDAVPATFHGQETLSIPTEAWASSSNSNKGRG